MSSLKEKFEQYSVEPDARVWNKISDTMHHKSMMRRRIIGTSTAAVVVLAVVGLIYTLSNSKDSVETNDSPKVAKMITQQPSSTGEMADINFAEIPTRPTETSHAPTANKATQSAPADAEHQTETVLTRPSQSIEAERIPVNAVTSTATETTVNASPSKMAVPEVEDSKIIDAESEKAAQTKSSMPRSVQPTNNSDELVVWIPTAFAPDDPNTDVQKFMVVPNNDAQIESFEIYIYSRAGRQVYHSKDYNQGWDGISNGHKQPMGAYVYIIEIKDAEKGLQHTRGTVTLLR